MKQKIIFFFLICFLGLLPFKVNAATVSIAGTKATAVVGGSITVNVTLTESKGLGSWEFSINYDSSMLQMTSGNAHVVDYVQGEGQKSKTYTYTFKVKKSGTAKISVVNTAIAAWDETTTSPTDSTSIRCLSQEEIAASYSKNNYLKSLSVEGYDIAFNKDTLEYQLEVENNVTKLVIHAEKEDNKASVSGTGEIEVHEGINTHQVVVTAENGSTKTYTLQITVKELNPIKVTMNDQEYTMVRKIDEIKDIVPTSFKETTLKIEEEDVLAFYNEVLDITIVALKNNEGKIGFYIYNEGKYQTYLQLTGGNVTIRILSGKKGISDKYTLYTLVENDQEIPVYRLKKSSTSYLVRGQNVETGQENIYVYDSIEKTLQRYYQDETNLLNEKLQLRSYIILGLLGGIIVLLITLLFLLRKKKTVKKKEKNKQEKKESLK